MLEDLRLSRRYEGLLYLAESSRNPPRLKSHHHVELELNLVVRGTITYVVAGKRFTFAPKTLLWLFPEQEHQLVDRSDSAQNYVAVFKPSLINKACRSDAYKSLKMTKRDQDGVLSTVLEPDSFTLIRKTMESLMENSLDPDVLNRHAGFGVGPGFSFEHGDPDGLNAGLRHLLLLCWRSQQDGYNFGSPVKLHRVVRRTLRLLSGGTGHQDLQELAKACGSSESHLSRTFHRQIGIPLTRYRNSLRLSRFWEEYGQSEQKTITEAMYASGFGSYAQFYKVFKQTYGCGPRTCLSKNVTNSPQRLSLV
jgi:methylphosphotriester-DNA--protein-cysteine methyltransferase